MGMLGKFIYCRFHHEPLGLDREITWFAPEVFNPKEAGYYAAQGNASRIFLFNEFPEYFSSWRLMKVQALPEPAYVASGGFSKPQFYPAVALPFIRRIEKILAR